MLSRESQVNWGMLHAEQGEPGKLGDVVTC